MFFYSKIYYLNIHFQWLKKSTISKIQYSKI